MSILQPYFIREEVIKSTRQFFFNQNFHEVITPSVNNAIPTEPNLYPFITKWNTFSETRDLYLSASPERGLKIMLGKGIGNCFAIGKSFRNLEGAGSLHIPEFLMLEWYRENATYEKIIKDTQELIVAINSSKKTITYQGRTINLDEKWEILSLVDLFKKYAGLNMEEIVDENVLFKKAEKKGYSLKGASFSSLFDQILVNEIEPNLPKMLFFLIDFPSRISPLCAIKKDKPYLSERFEFYMFGMEIANGNTENIDYKMVEDRFKKEQEYRQKNNREYSPIDTEFIEALKQMSDSGTTYAGIGLGIDRLAMIMADTALITDVELLHP